MISIDAKMAWRNIWRNPRRSILTVSAVVFATLLLVFMLSWQFGSYETMINASVMIHTGHLQVQERDYYEKRHIRSVVPAPVGIGAILEKTPGVRAFTYRTNAFALISSKQRTYGCLLTGIDPLNEARVSTLESIVREGEYLAVGDTNQALVGKLLARNLQVGLGNELVVLGQGMDGSVAATVVKVKGIFSSGQDEFDRSSIQIPLAYFQDVFAMNGSVHEVVALADSLARVAEIKDQLAKDIRSVGDGKQLAVLDWKELLPGLVQAIQMDLFSGFIFYIILIVVVAFSILNTFLMAVFERTREFGVMLAVGTTPGRLVKLLLFESAGTTMLGIVLGIIAGSLVTWYFQIHGIAIAGAEEIMRQYGLPERMHPQLSMLSITIGAGIVLVITLLTAMYPAFRVRRLRPVEAIMSA